MSPRSNAAFDPTRRNARIAAVVAGTFIALSCGTNYSFSAWAPQFAERLHLSATQTNLIGSFGNIGMYALGIPGGILIDSRGPRWGVFMGCLGLALGYYPLKYAYDQGPGQVSVPAMCLFALFTGIGSCTAFSAALKVCATNWPRHRGTATAFPLSAFGLSALFYTSLAAVLFPDDTSGYLALLATGTTAMVAIGMIFLRIVPVSETAYEPVPARDASRDRGRVDRSAVLPHAAQKRYTSSSALRDEERLPSSSASTLGGDADDIDPGTPSKYQPHHPRPDITGWTMLRTARFWQLFIMLSLLCGVGLMTINNIGNNARALWRHANPSVSRDFLLQRQLMHVSILSAGQFGGRLLSGIGSDMLVHRHDSRFWLLSLSALVFNIAQLLGVFLSDPNHLFLLSAATGLAYGMLFGVYPALVADAFGPSGMGINWGCMTWAPVISGNFFNLAYGAILDSHSDWTPTPDGRRGERVCDAGNACYSLAYYLTAVASAVGLVWSLVLVRQDRREAARERERERLERDP